MSVGETAATMVERLHAAQEVAGLKARADVARAEADVARAEADTARAELGEERRARLTADSTVAELHNKLEVLLLDAARLAKQLEAAGGTVHSPAPPAAERGKCRGRCQGLPCRGKETSGDFGAPKQQPRPVCARCCCVM